MRGKSPRVTFLLSLAVLLTVAHDQAQSQAPVPSSSAPFQIRQTAYIKASNPHANDHFACGGSLPGHIGNSAAISADGNIIAIGAHQESSAARTINGDQNDTSLYSAGAVYVYGRRGAGWAQQAYLKAANSGQSDNFGMNVALNADGSTLAVSAYYDSSSAKGVNPAQDDDAIPQAGAVYVFTRTGTTWTQQAYIKASNTGRPANPSDPEDWGDGDQFGSSIALNADGNFLAVGAFSEDSRASSINNDAFQGDDSASGAGAVYVFTRSGNTWTQRDYIKGANTDAGDLFGYTVGLSASGDTLAVGAYDEDGSGRSTNSIPDNRRGGTGAIYVFDRVGDAWRQTAYLKGSMSSNNDALGVSLSISADGNTIAAGAADESCLVPGINAPGCDADTWPPHLGAGTSGAAYVWARTGNAWTQQAFFKSTNPELEDWFGVRVSLSGDGNTLVVGAQNEDGSGTGLNGNQHDNSATEAGAVYIFTRTGATWTQRVYLKSSNDEAFDEFGSATAISGDGKTIVIGARMEASAAKGVNGNQNDNSIPGAGAAYVFTVN